MPGVLRTRVGYAGGRKENPTYHDLGDHTETTEIDFDPAKISYAKLLEVFWSTHNPCATPWSRQYMSAIFTHDEEQRRLATESRDREGARRGSKIHTLIAAGRFWRAEDYHQKYELRQNDDLMKEFRAHYPDERAFTDSTAAARANGYLGGNGTLEGLRDEIDRLGLSAEGRARLLAAKGGR